MQYGDAYWAHKNSQSNLDIYVASRMRWNSREKNKQDVDTTIKEIQKS